MICGKCKEKNLKIRIGVNGGSLEKELLEKYGSATPQALVESAMNHVKILEELDFKNPKLDIYNLDKFLEDKINKFIKSDIIQNNINSKFYKEYEFIEENESETNHGIVDLMLEYENHIDIIDYKLKNIDDKYYINQLNH